MMAIQHQRLYSQFQQKTLHSSHMAQSFSQQRMTMLTGTPYRSFFGRKNKTEEAKATETKEEAKTEEAPAAEEAKGAEGAAADEKSAAE